MAPVAVARSVGALAVVPAGGRLDAAVLSVALDDPHRPVRHPDRRPRQLAGPEPRRHEHAAGVVARRRLHDGARRQVPQLLPLGRRAVRPARLGPLVRQGERGRVHGVLRLRGRGPGDRAPLRRRARGLRHRRARGAGAPVRPGRARRCAVVPLLQPERAASAVGPGPGARRRVRRRGASDPGSADDERRARQARVRAGARAQDRGGPTGLHPGRSQRARDAAVGRRMVPRDRRRDRVARRARQHGDRLHGRQRVHVRAPPARRQAVPLHALGGRAVRDPDAVGAGHDDRRPGVERRRRGDDRRARRRPTGPAADGGRPGAGDPRPAAPAPPGRLPRLGR